jgi:hypothetical protein
MEVEAEGAAATTVPPATAETAPPAPPKKPSPPLYLPETETYLVTLAVTTALRLNRHDLATELATALAGGCLGYALGWSTCDRTPPVEMNTLP